MTRVVIVGAGGHAQVVADILQEMGSAGGDLEPAGYVDDHESLLGQQFLGLPVLGTLADLGRIPHDAVIVAVGDNARRRVIVERVVADGRRLATAIHPTAVVARSVVIGAGSVICAGAIVNPVTHLGRATILNTGCSVDHHNQIGDYVHIAPGARLGGTVSVGSESLIGIGAIVLPNLSIGSRTVVGGGAVVTASVADEAVVIGVPARAAGRFANS